MATMLFVIGFEIVKKELTEKLKIEENIMKGEVLGIVK